MTNQKVIRGEWLTETVSISYVEVCEKYDIPEALLVELFEHGLLQQKVQSLQDLTFDYEMIAKIESAARLKKDLGVNVPGIALVLDLLDELEKTREELAVLRRNLDMP